MEQQKSEIKKAASVTSEGYTGDIYCTICKQKISSGNIIAKLTPQTATPGKIVKDKSNQWCLQSPEGWSKC